MKSKTKEKKLPPKKSKVENKKNQKSKKKDNSEKTKKTDYPLWTMPEHLEEKDHNDLKRFYELYSQKKFDVALNFASSLDTIVREEIPSDIWEQCGGKLNKEQTKENLINDDQSPAIQPVDSIQKSEPIEIKFKSDKELEQLVMVNSQTFFGENALLFKDKNDVRDEHFPDKFLVDFSNSEKPRIYLVEITLPEQSFGQCFVRITHFFALLRNKQNHEELVSKLHGIINSDKEIKRKLQTLIKNNIEISEFLSTLLENKPLILLITSDIISELSLFAETYLETWGKMFKTLIIRKYSNEGETSNTMSPLFSDLLKGEKSIPEKVKCTEADHLEMMPERIRYIYNEIKTALLEEDNSLEFNPKKHYISIRKNKNLAFLHLRRKNVDIVIMNSENETKEQIKHHRIKTLPASVQKFWNGTCCTVVIENADNLGEVIDLLKTAVRKG